MNKRREGAPRSYSEHAVDNELVLSLSLFFLTQLAALNIDPDDAITTGAARRELKSTGPGPGGHGVRLLREPNASYKPLRTRPGKNDYPSFVVECCDLGSQTQLRNDARLWAGAYSVTDEACHSDSGR